MMDRNLYKYIWVLEFDKILNLLKEQAVCNDTKKLIENLRPNNSYQKILDEMVKTSDAYKLINSFNAPVINFVSDISNVVNKTQILAQLTIKELLLVSSFLENIYQISKWKKQSQAISTSLDYLFDNIVLIKNLKIKIDNVILSEDKIADSASDNLVVIRNKLNKNLAKIKETFDRLIKSATYQKCMQEPIVTMRDGRFVVPVKAEHKAEIKGLVHDMSSSGATLFVEPISVVEANNEIKILENQEREEINKILDMLSEQVRLNIDTIIKNYDILIKLDFYFAKAKLGFLMDAVVPQINNCQKIRLIKARHPLIDKSKVVPTNVSLGCDFNSLIITGPNTGGKTVVLKTVGLLTVMMMSGLMVPAAEGSELSVFDKVLVDIGDEQSIEQSLSTFSSHMTNIIYILDRVDKRSLVLIDELGAGTDPVEGASLAIAILEKFRSANAKVVATTHYPELKLYALDTDGVENASCEFDIESLRPTYRLLVGVPGRSNAFLISKKLGLSDEILEKARLLIGDDENKFENVVSKLEHSQAELDSQNKEVAVLRQKIKEDQDTISQIKNQIENSKKHEVTEFKMKIGQITSEIEAKSKEIFRELDDILKQRNHQNFNKMVEDLRFNIRSKVKKINNLASSITHNYSTTYNTEYRKDVDVKEINIGDKVKVLDINQCGVVVREKDQNGFYLVQIGVIKNKVHFSNLVVVGVQVGKKNNATAVVNQKISSKKFSNSVELELDLRGKTVEEALIDLDKFVDDAVVLSLVTIRVIHGKGTGVLRAAVREFLKSDGRVKNFRLGVYGEGEDGVTVVSLK